MSTVRVGVGCFVFNSEGQFVVGTRKGSHGAGCLQLPGGHLEVGETFEHCARREIFEETGINLDSREEDVIKFVTSTNDVFDESEGGKHYVTVFMACRVDGAVQPKVMEPEKCESWEWTTWEQLKRIAASEDENERNKLFLPLRNLIRQRPGLDPTKFVSL